MRLLDLFCGAGGCAVGYHRAGFTEIVGVDVNQQPRYPFAFLEADALDFMRGMLAGGSPLGYRLDDFDAIHASPPCQAYSQLASLSNTEHPELVVPVRNLLIISGKTWVIENVIGAPLNCPVLLCGSMFGLGIWRHRIFESSVMLMSPFKCKHKSHPNPIDVTGTGGPFNGTRKASGGGVSRKPHNIAHAQRVMGIDWMTRREISQAIPPAYTEFIGKQLIAHLQG